MKKVLLILLTAIVLTSCNSKPTLADLGISEYEFDLASLDVMSSPDTTYICFFIEHNWIEDTVCHMEFCQVDSVEVIFRNPEDSSVVARYKAPFRLKDPKLRQATFGDIKFDNPYYRDSYDWIAVPDNVVSPGTYILELKAPKCKPVYKEVEVGEFGIFYTHIERRHVIVD